MKLQKNIKIILITLIIILFTISLINNYNEVYYDCEGVSDDECIYRFYESKGHDREDISFGDFFKKGNKSIFIKGSDVVVGKSAVTPKEVAEKNLSMSFIEKVKGIFSFAFWIR